MYDPNHDWTAGCMPEASAGWYGYNWDYWAWPAAQQQQQVQQQQQQVQEQQVEPQQVQHQQPQPQQEQQQGEKHTTSVADGLAHGAKVLSDVQSIPKAEGGAEAGSADNSGLWSPSYHGRLKTFSAKNGYGFIACPTLREVYARDVYINKVQLPEGASCGCLLKFKVSRSAWGQPQAHDVSIMEDEAADLEKAVKLLRRDLLTFELMADCPESKNVPSFRLVTWNVLAASYVNMKVFPDVDLAVFPAPRRRAQIAAVLEHLQGDIVCLQEVDCSLEELGLVGFDHVIAQRPRRCDACVIAWRRDRFELGPAGHCEVSFDDHPLPARLSASGNSQHGNVGILAQLRFRGDGDACKEGNTISVATTHLCWEPDKDDLRAWQLQTFLEVVRSIAGPHFVLCGDLNAKPGTTSHRYLCEESSGLASVYRDVEGTGLTNCNAAACHGGYAAMIDYVWYELASLSVKQRLCLPNLAALLRRRGLSEDGPAKPVAPTLLSVEWPSDHVALAVDLVLEGSKHKGNSSWGARGRWRNGARGGKR